LNSHNCKLGSSSVDVTFIDLALVETGHHRWVDSAMERSSANMSALAALRDSAYDSLRDSRSRTSPLQKRAPNVATIRECREREKESLEMQAYLLASRGEELGLLRSNILCREEDGTMTLKLARAEYSELRAMHLMFVEASNKKVADLHDACLLRQQEIDALRQEREAERKDRDRWGNELDLTRRTLAEKVTRL